MSYNVSSALAGSACLSAPLMWLEWQLLGKSCNLSFQFSLSPYMATCSYTAVLPSVICPAINFFMEGIFDCYGQTHRNETLTEFWRTVRKKSNSVKPELEKGSLKNLLKEINLFKITSKKFVTFLNKEQ